MLLSHDLSREPKIQRTSFFDKQPLAGFRVQCAEFSDKDFKIM